MSINTEYLPYKQLPFDPDQPYLCLYHTSNQHIEDQSNECEYPSTYMPKDLLSEKISSISKLNVNAPPFVAFPDEAHIENNHLNSYKVISKANQTDLNTRLLDAAHPLHWIKYIPKFNQKSDFEL